uniref:Transportin-1 n=1 Tax=Panagrellus redivivus TaxID=6233 RepID=A0A7E4UNT7_PANRE
MSTGALWQPSENDLNQVLLLLQHSQSPDNATQKEVQQRLDDLNMNPEFCRYLMHVLAEMPSQVEPVRAVAGLLLKNCIKYRWQYLPSEVHEFLKIRCLGAIGDESVMVRRTVGIILTTIFVYEGTANWPALIPTLLAAFQGEQYSALEGALGALNKICEDSAERFNAEEVNQILHPCIMFFQSSDAKLRALALSTVNSIILMQNEAVGPYLDQFLSNLSALLGDADHEVQKQLCRALTLLLECHIEKIAVHLPNIAGFVLTKTQDPSHEIALEACEFWLALSENTDICKSVLAPMLPNLFPVLLRCMQYTADDIAILKGDVEDDRNVPDRDEDIKPRFHKGRTQGGTIVNPSDDPEDDDEDDSDDTVTDWNLRKCAAASLDVLSSIFGDDCLAFLLPTLRECISSPNWVVKESGILAIGAVAEGCQAAMTPHLPELIPFLINALSEPKALVRSIACWTVSRYCYYVTEPGRDEIFTALLRNLLERILDNNKRVQEAACSAFATFEEEAASGILPYLRDIVGTFVEAFKIYQAKNLLILYDAIGTLADSAGDQLIEMELLPYLVNPIVEKLMTLSHEDREVYPVLECLSTITLAVSGAIKPYAPVVFRQCRNFIEQNLCKCMEIGTEASKMREAIQANNGIPTEQQLQFMRTLEQPDKELLVIALDLLSELTEAIGVEAGPLIAEGDTRLLQLLFFCINDINAEVRQSAFALIGDIARTCFPLLHPFCQLYMPVMANNIKSDNVSVCNNAVWGIGEIAMRMGAGIKQYLHNIFNDLIIVMLRERPAAKTLQENCAITLGRIGMCCPTEIAPTLNTFVRQWCFILRTVRDNAEKESAFIGLGMLIRLNPPTLHDHFIFITDAVCSWTVPTPNVKTLFGTLFVEYRTSVGDNWGAFIQQFPSNLRDKLLEQYGI